MLSSQPAAKSLAGEGLNKFKKSKSQTVSLFDFLGLFDFSSLGRSRLYHVLSFRLLDFSGLSDLSTF